MLIAHAHCDIPRILVPYLFVSATSVEIHEKDKETKQRYFIQTLGDQTLADQLTQYSAVANVFDVCVYDRKQILMEQLFQNIELSSTCVFKNKFDAVMHPQPYTFVLRPEILHAATNYVSALRINHQPIVGIHVKRNTYAVSPLLPTKQEYYQNAMQTAYTTLESTGCTVLVVGDGDGDASSLSSYIRVEETQLIQFAILTLVDVVICSTSPFAWWASTMNEDARLIVAPDKLIDANIMCNAKEIELKYRDLIHPSQKDKWRFL
jgi:hypothetical protein